MKNHPPIERLHDAALKEIFSQLARKYSGQRVFKIWEKIKMAGEDEAYFRTTNNHRLLGVSWGEDSLVKQGNKEGRTPP